MRARVLLASSVAVVLLAACSGGDDNSSSGPGSSTTGARPTAVAAEPSRGCGIGNPAAPGTEKLTLDQGGTPRWFYRRLPPQYDGKTPLPLVLDLHGYSEGADVHTKMSNLGPFGDEKGFITITPQGTGPVPRWDTGAHSPDTKFVLAALDMVNGSTCVDLRRVDVTGLSNGAFFTSALACEHPDRFAAAAPVAGIRDVKGCKTSRPVPVVAFHGTADQFVSYDGGYGPAVANLPAPDGSGKRIGQDQPAPGSTRPQTGPSIPDITAAWAKRNGCSAKTTDTAIASDVTRIAFACPRGDDVVLYRVQGGGHSWPGSAFSTAVASVVGPTTNSIDANEIMWDFFQAHPLPG
jgi:polyhydroxybutyrate depolymerase